MLQRGNDSSRCNNIFILWKENALTRNLNGLKMSIKKALT